MGPFAGVPLAWRIRALQASVFAVIGVMMPFFPVWLAGRGLDPATIGVLLSVPILARIVVTAPLVRLADSRTGPRTMIGLAQGCIACVFLALSLTEGAVAIAVAIAFLAILQAPIVPLADLVTIEAVRRDSQLNYAGIRLWGSLSFLVWSAGAGFILSGAPGDATIWLLALLAGLAAIVSLAVPADLRDPAAASASSARAPLPRALLLIIAGAALVQASHAALYAFGSIAWRAQGYGEAAIGLYWAVGVIAEIMLFAWLGRRMGREATGVAFLALGAVAACVRFTGLAFAPGPAATFLLQILHGASFGLSHLGAMAALTFLAPPGTRGRAQGLLAAASAAAMAAGMMSTGALYDSAGTFVYLAMAPLALAGLVFALLAAAAMRVQPQSSREGG